MKHAVHLIALGISLSLSGCAGVTFYSDSGLTNKTGIPIYGPKPYLLVARTGAKDKPVEVSIVYLPDSENVIYARPHAGFGTAKMSLALSNGQLTAYGQETDPKLAELITSIGGLITARAGAVKTEAEANQLLKGAGTQQSADAVFKTGQEVLKLSIEMQRAVKPKPLPGLLASEIQTIQSAADVLKRAGNDLADLKKVSSAPDNLALVKAQSEELAKLPAPGAGSSTPRDSSLQIVKAWSDYLEKLLKYALPEKPDPATFELYEIIRSNGTTALKKVSP